MYSSGSSPLSPALDILFDNLHSQLLSPFLDRLSPLSQKYIVLEDFCYPDETPGWMEDKLIVLINTFQLTCVAWY